MPCKKKFLNISIRSAECYLNNYANEKAEENSALFYGRNMITSTANTKVKRVVALQEKSKNRVKENVFIVEGPKMFEEAPMERILEVYVEQNLFEELTAQGSPIAAKIEDCKAKGIFTETVSSEVFGKMSDTKSPQGILCIMERYAYECKEMISKAVKKQKETGHKPLFLLLEDIQDPGNLGTMIRTAEGAGADGILMTRGCVDIYNPKTIRATMGSLYRMPFYYGESMEEMISFLKEQGILVYAAHLKGEKYYHEMEFPGGSAFLIGNEGNGLKKETADAADLYLKIPMEGKLESLNAAVAAALLIYHARFGA